MDNILPTRGQLERQLSQTLQSLYRQQFGHLPSKIVCHLFDESKQGNENLLLQVRSKIDDILKPKLAKVIENTIEVEVKEILSGATSVGNTLGTLVVLSQKPAVQRLKTSKLKEK